LPSSIIRLEFSVADCSSEFTEVKQALATARADSRSRRLEAKLRNAVTRVYRVRGNSDLVEGKGADVVLGYYKTEAEALAVARDKANWIMGKAPACTIEVMDLQRERLMFERFYAFGVFADGTLDVAIDPEYEEYLRLREKFEPASS
jgi:hypothetical protein